MLVISASANYSAYLYLHQLQAQSKSKGLISTSTMALSTIGLESWILGLAQAVELATTDGMSIR